VGPAIGIGAATTKNRELFWYAEASGSFASATVMFCTHLLNLGDFNTGCMVFSGIHTRGKKPVKVPVVGMFLT